MLEQIAPGALIVRPLAGLKAGGFLMRGRGLLTLREIGWELAHIAQEIVGRDEGVKISFQR